MTRRLLLLILFLGHLPLAGCYTVAEAPEAAERRQVYQTIANALPQVSLGWGPPPGIVEMSRAAREEGPPPPVEPVKATEAGFRIIYQVYREQNAWIPYSAIRQAAFGMEDMPNWLFGIFIVLPLQVVHTTVVIDTARVPGLRQKIESDCKRLEFIARQVGMGGPYSHAQNVRAKLEWDEATYGPGMLSLRFARVGPLPPWIPLMGKARRLAEAFAWAAAHPDEPELEPEEDETRENAKEAPDGETTSPESGAG